MHFPPCLLVAFVLIGGFAAGSEGPAEIAARIIDDRRPQAEREALIAGHPELSDRLIAAMAADLKPGTSEEDRRIPWIWRIAIAAGKRNDADELRRILDVALPVRLVDPLDPWRVVVIGGGIINGISLEGNWPRERLEAVLRDHEELEARWQPALAFALAMHDDATFSTGTRYDALRMIAMLEWDFSGGALFTYLLKGVHPELQQGAISGLNDVQSPCVAQALLSGFDHYTPENKALALDALIRDERRISTLLDAIENGHVKVEELGERRIERLTGHPDAELRRRAGTLLKR